MKYVAEAFATNYVAPLGPMTEAFEEEFRRRLGFKAAVSLNSGTAALHLALHVLGVSKGDEVLVSDLTFIGGVSPVVYLGATPVFIDSERASWNMDPDLLAEELAGRAARGNPPKAVVPTDLYGQSSDVDRLVEACNRYEVPVVLDSAEALGAMYKGGSAGLGGKAAIFSFNGNKIITTSGGGMLASNDPDLIAKARFLAQQAREPAIHYEHRQIGYNYRMSNILAAIGLGQLSVLDERVRQRRKVFSYYQDRLGDLPGIEFMPEASYGVCSRWLTVVLITPELFGRNREDVCTALKEANIESRPVWKPMHLQPVFEGFRVRGGAVSEDLFRRGLCLPSGSAMTEQDLDRVVSVVRSCNS